MFKKPQLAKATLSDNDSDVEVPTDSQFETFNENYSVMLTMTREFFAQCRKSIVKYVSFNKAGVKMNVGGVLGWLNTNQTAFDETAQQNIARFKKAKELQFEDLLAKVRQLVSDLIDYQKNFKQEFTQTFIEEKKEPKSPDRLPTKKFDVSVKSETTKISDTVPSVKSGSHVNDNIDDVTDRKLREQLRRIVLPKPIALRSESAEPPKDLKSAVDRITQKMEFLKQQMRLERERQEKIVEIFNRNKIIVPDVDLTDPGTLDLHTELETARKELLSLREEVEVKRKQHGKLASRLLQEMTREDRTTGEKIFENDEFVVTVIRKNAKTHPPHVKLVSLSCKSLLNYIYVLQQRLALLAECRRKHTFQSLCAPEEPALQKMPSAINLNMSFTNVYSPIEVRNIINGNMLKKK